MRIGSAAKLTADYLTEDEATRLASGGWAKISSTHKNRRCESWTRNKIDAGSTLKA